MVVFGCFDYVVAVLLFWVLYMLFLGVMLWCALHMLRFWCVLLPWLGRFCLRLLGL